jgi:predicted O-methyltransferase YrrM
MLTTFLRAAGVTLLATAALLAQTPDKTSEEFRKQFLTTLPQNGLSTTVGDAAMLRVLIQASGAKRGVEVGVAHGFGSINMGMAFERNKGQLFSLEIDPQRAAKARENIAKVGLEKTVNVIAGDALEVLPKLEGQFDFIFIDANKPDYMKYLKAIEPKLKRGALVVADNVIVSARHMPDFLEYVRTSPDYETVTIRASDEKKDGMTISYKKR